MPETIPLESPTPAAVTTETTKKEVVPLARPPTVQEVGGGVEVVIALAAQVPSATGVNVPVGDDANATW